MTRFQKNATSGGVVAAIDPAFQLLALAAAGAASGLAVSTAMGSAAAPYFAALPDALRPEAIALVTGGANRFLWDPHGRLFLVQWAALYAPFAASLLLIHLSLPGLHRNARRLGAYLLAATYVILSLCVLKASNHAWRSSDLLAFLPTGSVTVFQFLRAALFTLAALGLCVPFVFQGQRDSGRVMRLVVVVGLFAGWVAWDWKQSRRARSLGEESLAANVTHRLVLLLPDVTQDTLLEALAMPESQGFKERMLALAPVLPVSAAEMPQTASLLTGVPPWRHGVRSDTPSKETLVRVAPLAAKGDTDGRLRHFANPGLPHMVGTLFGALGTSAHLCSPDTAARARVAVLEASPLLPGLVPTRFVATNFPEAACSQRYAPLETLVARELDAVATGLREKPAMDAWIYVRPHPIDGWQGLEEEWQETPTPAALRQLTAHRLAGVLQVVSDQLSSWGTWQNTDVWVVGLGGRSGEWGAFSVHSGAPDRGAAKELGGVLVSQVTLGKMLHGPGGGIPGSQDTARGDDVDVAAARAGTRARLVDFEAYAEAPLIPHGDTFEPWMLDANGGVRERADWQRTALARSDRTTLCRVERTLEAGGKAVDSLLVTLHGGRKAAMARLDSRTLVSADSLAPTFKTPEDCLKAARDALVGTWTLDVDLPPLKWELLARAELPSQEKQEKPTPSREANP